MTEHPILFTGAMVRAILDGSKTQTRRVVKLPEPTRHVVVDPGGTVWGPGPYVKAYRNADMSPSEDDNLAVMHARIHCPYGYPGDQMWVKETWCYKVDPVSTQPTDTVLYQADGRHVYKSDEDGGIALLKDGTEASPWQSPLFLRRVDSRITLEVTDIRVERVQDISEKDATAEGMTSTPYYMADGTLDEAMSLSSAVNFAGLWDSINAKKGCGWNVNPYVWAVTFGVAS